MTMFLKRFATAATVAAATIGVAVTGSAPASASPSASLIGYGHVTSGAGVWCVQHDINYDLSHNYSELPIPLIAEDSEWGPETENAVKWLQTGFGLTADGVVGQQTGSRLLWLGDPRYNGTWDHPGYCYWYVPGTL